MELSYPWGDIPHKDWDVLHFTLETVDDFNSKQSSIRLFMSPRIHTAGGREKQDICPQSLWYPLQQSLWWHLLSVETIQF